MQTTADVVIVGAGVIGCSTAYHLAEMGMKDVAVLEMDQVGGGSSGKSASMLSLQFCQNEIIARMTRLAYARYMKFEEEIGTPIDFKKIGWLSLATEESAGNLREHVKMLQSVNIETETLEPEDIKRFYPQINTEDIALGTWGPDDGSLDPHMIMWGYMKRASLAGVRLYEGVRATGLTIRDGKVEGVVTERGVLSTRLVVNAGGPWAVEVGRWVDIEIPIKNSARCIVVTGPLREISRNAPFVEDLTAEWYFRPEGAGVLMGMGAVPAERMDIQIHREIMDEMVETAIHRVPVLERASLLTAWTGIRPLTEDNLPILGPVPSLDGFLLNCGWGGMGIILAPLAGQLIAEYITRGYSSTMDMRLFGIERFAKVR